MHLVLVKDSHLCSRVIGSTFVLHVFVGLLPNEYVDTQSQTVPHSLTNHSGRVFAARHYKLYRGHMVCRPFGCEAFGYRTLQPSSSVLSCAWVEYPSRLRRTPSARNSEL
eukprot:Lankesteria_metandrocarpae@DN1990_c0_g1_i2.p1